MVALHTLQLKECDSRLRKRNKKVYSEYDDDIFMPFEIPPILIEEEKSKNGIQSKTKAKAQLPLKSSKKWKNSANGTIKSVKAKYKTQDLSSKRKIHAASKIKQHLTSGKTKQNAKIKTKTKLKTSVCKQTGESLITTKHIVTATSSHNTSHITSKIRPCTVKVRKRSLKVKQLKVSKIKKNYTKCKEKITKKPSDEAKELSAMEILGGSIGGSRKGWGGDTEGSRKGWRIPACILEIVPEHVPRLKKIRKECWKVKPSLMETPNIKKSSVPHSLNHTDKRQVENCIRDEILCSGQLELPHTYLTVTQVPTEDNLIPFQEPQDGKNNDIYQQNIPLYSTDLSLGRRLPRISITNSKFKEQIQPMVIDGEDRKCQNIRYPRRRKKEVEYTETDDLDFERIENDQQYVNFTQPTSFCSTAIQPGDENRLDARLPGVDQVSGQLSPTALTWNSTHTVNKQEVYCYCGTPGDWFRSMVRCVRCKQWFHERCLQPRPRSMPIVQGDTFYLFVCSVCNYGVECLKRLPLSWEQFVHVAIFDLSLKHQKSCLNLMSEIYPALINNCVLYQVPKYIHSHPDKQTKILQILQFSGKFVSTAGGSEYGLKTLVPPPIPNYTLHYSGVVSERNVLDDAVRLQDINTKEGVKYRATPTNDNGSEQQLNKKGKSNKFRRIVSSDLPESSTSSHSSETESSCNKKSSPNPISRNKTGANQINSKLNKKRSLNELSSNGSCKKQLLKKKQLSKRRKEKLTANIQAVDLQTNQHLSDEEVDSPLELVRPLPLELSRQLYQQGFPRVCVKFASIVPPRKSDVEKALAEIKPAKQPKRRKPKSPNTTPPSTCSSGTASPPERVAIKSSALAAISPLAVKSSTLVDEKGTDRILDSLIPAKSSFLGTDNPFQLGCSETLRRARNILCNRKLELADLTKTRSRIRKRKIPLSIEVSRKIWRQSSTQDSRSTVSGEVEPEQFNNILATKTVIKLTGSQKRKSMKQTFKKETLLFQNSSQFIVNGCHPTNKVNIKQNSSISGVVKEESSTYVFNSNQVNGNQFADKNKECPIIVEDSAIKVIDSSPSDKNALDLKLRSQVLSHMTERFKTEVTAGTKNGDSVGHMIKNEHVREASKECSLNGTFINGDMAMTTTLAGEKSSQLTRPLSNERMTRHSADQLFNNQTINQRLTRHNNSQLSISRRAVNQLSNGRSMQLLRNGRSGKLRVTGRFKSSAGEQRVLFQRTETEKRCTEM